jgi:hypothetical protein
MALTLWINSTSGERLDDRQMRDLRHRARALYAVNSHIFEDELDALTALGVVSSVSAGGAPMGPPAPQCGAAPSEHRLFERSESAPRRRRINSAGEPPQPIQIMDYYRPPAGGDEPAAA